MTDVLLDGIKDVLPLMSRRELVSKWIYLQRDLQKYVYLAIRGSNDSNWQLTITVENDSALFEQIRSMRRLKDFFKYVPIEHDETTVRLNPGNYSMIKDFIDQEIIWHNTVIATSAMEGQSDLSRQITECRSWLIVIFFMIIVTMFICMKNF